MCRWPHFGRGVIHRYVIETCSRQYGGCDRRWLRRRRNIWQVGGKGCHKHCYRSIERGYGTGAGEATRRRGGIVDLYEFERSPAVSDQLVDRNHPGTALKNTQLIKNLTADGSNLADWGKYTTRTFNGPSGPFQVHFYMNSSTGTVHYLDDFKVVFNGPR